MPIVTTSSFNLKLAASILLNNKNVAFPTETVYGLGGNALSDEAVKNIYKLKGRPLYNPLIVHFKNLDMVLDYFDLNHVELTIAKNFWPGPLTLILNKHKANSPKISSLCYGNHTSLGVRVPGHPIAQHLLNTTNLPIAAPSANASNQLSPTLPSHVLSSLPYDDLLILNNNKPNLGLESTIIEVIDGKINILRYGSLNLNKLTKLGLDIVNSDNENQQNSPKAPGNLSKHYSPKTKLRLNASNVNNNEALLAFGEIPQNLSQAKVILNLSPSGNIEEAAHNLFAMLWELDNLASLHNKHNPLYFNSIAVMEIPTNNYLGVAINDRLKRASSK